MIINGIEYSEKDLQKIKESGLKGKKAGINFKNNLKIKKYIKKNIEIFVTFDLQIGLMITAGKSMSYKYYLTIEIPFFTLYVHF